MIDVVGGVIINEGKLLVVRSKGRDTFFLPGGTRETGESDLDTLEREIMEETSLIVKNSIFYTAFVTRNNDNTKELNATVYLAETDGVASPDTEIEEIAWIDRKDFSGYKLSNVLKVIIPKLIKDKIL